MAEPQGILDMDLLKSALGVPAATYAGRFLHEGLHEMAADYLFHLVKNHPFVDGNKRVGTVAALIFLDLNGLELNAPQDDLAEMALAVAQGEEDKADVTMFLKRWTASR